ncbi:MAG: D-2-hydroxyacid dehydrogenase [Rhodospirillales bacterium]|nr:D-2-hydroxyacid dehydrogenase [Rhodospirillales bacterium]
MTGDTMIKRNGRLHLHLENLSWKPAVFSLTPQLARSAQKRHPDLARHVDFTVGEDFRTFDKKMRNAHMLLTSQDVILHPKFPMASLKDVAPRLKVIHLIGAGVERVLPLDWLPPGVRLTNNSGVHADKAYESWTMGLIALNFRLPAILENQRKKHWEQIFTSAIRGKTVTIVGLGRLGRSAVRAARDLGMRVIGVSRSGKKVPGVERVYRSGQIVTAVKSADFVLVAIPLTPDTRHLLDRNVLRAMKPGVKIFNMGRADVMDYDALADLLKKGHVEGAILDVFSPEPLPASSPLWSARNLIVIPHVCSDDLDTYMDGTMDLVCRILRRLLAGREPMNVVQPERGY